MPFALLLALCLSPDEALEGLRSPSLADREAAVRALARSGIPCDALAEHLAHPDLRVALGVAEALRERGDPAALPFLAEAAGHPDPERGEAAARAHVELALDCGREAGEGGGEGIGGRRLLQATRAAVIDQVARTESWRAEDQPQRYRRLLDGGPRVGAALAELAADRHAEASRRAVAIAVLPRWAGEEALPLLLPLVEDPEPAVRAAAAAALLATGAEEAYARLALLLETQAGEEPNVRSCALAAVKRGGVPTRAGVDQLVRLVQLGPAPEASHAAAALQRADPERAATVVGARVRALLGSGRAVEGADLAAGLFLVRGGPVGPELEAACRGSGEALVRLCVTPAREEALAGLRPFLAPDRTAALRETLRIEIVEALLRRHAAPWCDRAAFAGPLLLTDVTRLRAKAASLLEGAPAAELAPLRPLLEPCLQNPNESVRVAAAAALAESAPEAVLPVLAHALHDGDAYAASVAVRALKTMGRIPAGFAWNAPPAERRALARGLLRGGSGKE
ncbi:MAG: HEAT repeat domain-containing protein [Planctomycetaceae bacterium]